MNPMLSMFFRKSSCPLKMEDGAPVKGNLLCFLNPF